MRTRPPARLDVQQLPGWAERAVRLAWVQAYLDALGLTGEVNEARWEQALQALQAPDRDAFARVWTAPATSDESQDALVEARRALRVEDPQTLGAGLDVDWRRVTVEALRRWWEREEDARELLRYAAPRISRKALVRLAAACARTALRYVPAGEERPRITIETAEAWARGEATLQQLRTASVSASASATAAAATAAASAASAASAAGYATSGYADYYAASAASAAADDASAAADDAASAAREALRAMADLIRSMQPFPGGP